MVVRSPSKLRAQSACPVSVDLSRALMRTLLPASLQRAGKNRLQAQPPCGLDRGRVPSGFRETDHPKRADLSQLGLELIGNPLRQVDLPRVAREILEGLHRQRLDGPFPDGAAESREGKTGECADRYSQP